MLPTQKEIEIPLLQALVELGGRARPKDVYPLVAKRFPNIPEIEFESRLKSGGNRWNNRVQFTRQALKDQGEIDSPARGIWQITQKGQQRLYTLDNTYKLENSEYLKGALATGKSLQDATKIRKNKYQRITVSKNEVQEHLKQGYSIDRELSRTVKLKKPKPIGEQFENEVWLLLKQFGFSTLNSSGDFHIDISIPSKPSRWEQIDVFAKDGDYHVFVVECKCSEKPSNRHRDLRSAIDSFAANSVRIRDSIRQYFNDEKTKRLKITFIIATRNIVWTDSLRQRAESNSIYVWRDEDIKKLSELANLQPLIGEAVRFQLYASMFRGQEIKALENQRIAAIEGKAGNFTYYQFIATPNQLLPIAFVHRRGGEMNQNSDFDKPTQSYQRMLRQSKVKAISKFIDERKFFPNNIIISFDEEPRFDLDSHNNNLEFRHGLLTLPNKYGSAWLIDGQHRLYGFANSEKGKFDPIPVIAFRNLNVSEQARIFIEINKNQTNVDPNLLWDLYGDIYQGTEDVTQKEELTISNVVKLLDKTKGSPFIDHIFIPSHGSKSKKRNITMSTLCLGIKKNGLIAIDMLGLASVGKDQEDFEKFIAQRIASFFGMAQKHFPEDWKRGDKGFLRTNNGISAFLIIFRRILRHLISHENFVFTKVNTSDFEDEVYTLLAPAIDYLRQEKDRPTEFRRRSGQSGQQEGAEELLNQIKDAYPDYFHYTGNDSRVNDKASIINEDKLDLDQLIKNTELRLRTFIMDYLKQIHGKAWFRRGIPGEVKSRINSHMEQDIRKHPYRETEIRNNLENRLEYSNLGQLKEIVKYSQNWAQFDGVFGTQTNVEIHFNNFNDLRNAYRGHMRNVDPILMASGQASINWIQLCMANIGY